MTEQYDNWDAFQPLAGSVYIHRTSVEERSEHSVLWEDQSRDVTFMRITRESTSEFVLEGWEQPIKLRSLRELSVVADALGERLCYLDITGLSHHVWAPLLRAILISNKAVRVVYVEPMAYAMKDRHSESEIFDLSERTEGIKALPGFASIVEPLEEQPACFIPLVGFEGTRLAHIVEKIQPTGGRIIPIVGVPGLSFLT